MDQQTAVRILDAVNAEVPSGPGGRLRATLTIEILHPADVYFVRVGPTYITGQQVLCLAGLAAKNGVGFSISTDGQFIFGK